MTEDEIKTLLYIRGQGGKSHGLELPDVGIPDYKTSLVEECFKQTSHGFKRGQIIYHNGTKYALAKADTLATTGFLMVTEVINTSNFCAAIVGHVKNLARYFTPLILVPGVKYYVSDTVAGAITSIEPTISNPIFIADSTDSGWVIPYRPIDTSSGTGISITVSVPVGPSTIVLDTISSLVAKWFISVQDDPLTKLTSETIVGTNLPSGATWNQYAMLNTQLLNYDFSVEKNLSGNMELKITNNESFPLIVKFNKEIIT